MEIHESIRQIFMDKKRVYALLALAFIFVLAISLSSLTTKPRIWTDEAVSIEIAKHFAHAWSLDVVVAPGEVTGFPHFLQSTGYTVTIPLGILFKLFGEHFELARFLMLLWMLVALYAVFCFLRASHDRELALLGVFLIATFASFHGSGRAVVGEIPGFVFLLFSLYYAFEKRSYALAGIFLGLAIVTKPSVFLIALSAFLFVLAREPRMLVRRLAALCVGMLPSVALWFSLVGENLLSMTFWSELSLFYRNPYSADIGANISMNLANFFHSTTLIYFLILFMALVLARFWVRRKETAMLYDAVVVYALFAFAYYLRSPGWLRYLLIAELLILLVLPHALFTLFHVLQQHVQAFRNLQLATATVLCASTLVIVQGIHLLTAADIYGSDAAIRTAQELGERYRDKRVAVIGDIGLYALLRNLEREVVLDLTGMPTLGRNPLLREVLPDIVVTGNNRFREEGKKILEASYAPLKKIHGYEVFERVR